jgi:hypothetical protein
MTAGAPPQRYTADFPFDKAVWMGRLSLTIGAVLGGVQVSHRRV